MTPSPRTPRSLPQLPAKTALGRIVEPEDVGRAISFLLADGTARVTGQDVEASGGLNL